MHEVALLDDQVSVDAPPLLIVLGLALRLTVGELFALTVTVADCAALPPLPRAGQCIGSVCLSAPVDCEPVNGLLPDQAPEAAHEVALVEDQVNVAVPPLVTALGPALRMTVGVAAFTETVADCAALPPAPVQDRV